ncbi:MAG: A/G-specific adenine glycosylase [Bacteroidota bacterium]
MRRVAHKKAHPLADHAQARKLHISLLRWYARHGRTLPWRGISNPYRILISEVMLQQTQVQRVLEKYPAFLRRFPTLRALAAARRRDVVVAWRGMGYNNRAVRLHRLAQSVVHTHNGKLPRDINALMELPGIGRYTANALLSSAFGAQVPVVDVNVQRVLSRVFWKMGTTMDMKNANAVWPLAGALLPKGRAYQWNQALMDLGATVCVARNPRCEQCPVGHLCASRGRVKPARRTMVRPEPSLDGIPNRIYRGRIIEELRRNGGTRSLAANVLGKKIKTEGNDAWLWTLLQGLQRDGIIVTRGTGSLAQRRVSLA